MRSTAAKLLQHPWLLNPDTHLNKTSALIAAAASNSAADEETQGIVRTLRLVQRDLKEGKLLHAAGEDLAATAVSASARGDLAAVDAATTTGAAAGRRHGQARGSLGGLDAAATACLEVVRMPYHNNPTRPPCLLCMSCHFVIWR